MRCPRQLYQNLLLHLEFVMASVCKICAGPIEPLDQHLHCVACLGLAHAEAALDESDCGLCADLPVRVLRARRDVVRVLFGVGLTAASVPLVSPPSPGSGSAVLPCRRTQRSPHSPISFPEDCFPPPFQHRGIRSLWPRGGRRGHVHLGLGEGGVGRIGARAIWQLRAFRPPGGAHEGSI